MCIACEMGFYDMLEALTPEERERILREEAARRGYTVPAAPFVCEPFETEAPHAQRPDTSEDERKP